MKNKEYDALEEQLLQDIENDALRSVPDVKKEIIFAREMVQNQQKKDHRMNIRISGNDLQKLKTMAMEEGLPYQTYVTSILHKFVQGKLKEE